MRAGELRYGNLIQRDGVTWVVNDIFGASGLVTVLPGIDGETLGRRSVHDFEPIPLTEEWLMKFGFRDLSERKDDWDELMKQVIAENHICYDIDSEKHYDEQLKMEYETSNLEVELNEDGSWYANYCFINISYVHQLQNLYFVRTGNELNLTP